MSESGIIGTDVPVTARPYEPDPHRKMTVRGKTVTEGEFLSHIRTTKYAREIHSDGFLAITNPARTCSCGGCAVASDGYICPRCGRQVE